MYGYDGNFCALEWAEKFGLRAVNETDRQKLINEKCFTPQGKRILEEQRVIPNDPD